MGMTRENTVRTKRVILNIPEDTMEILSEFAESIGNGAAPAGVAKLWHDAVRYYEWVAYQQLEGKIITALEQREIDCLEKNNFTHDDDRVERIFADRDADKVRAYFEKAA